MDLIIHKSYPTCQEWRSAARTQLVSRAPAITTSLPLVSMATSLVPPNVIVVSLGAAIPHIAAACGGGGEESVKYQMCRNGRKC